MSQNIQLQQRVVHGVEVEVGGGNIRAVFFGGVLHRGEIFYLILCGNNDHSARVLSRCTFDTCAAKGKTQLFCTVDCSVPLFEILFNVAVGGLLCNGGYRACLENVGCAEQLFCIFVCP